MSKVTVPMLHHVDRGNARIYYTISRTLVCFQEGTEPGHYDYYQCSQDGEPNHLLILSKRTLRWLQQPVLDTKFVRRFWAYIQKEREKVNAEPIED